MDNYKLLCYIEGTNSGFGFIISKDKMVFELKQLIQREWCNSYCDGVNANTLVLLKVIPQYSPLLFQSTLLTLLMSLGQHGHFAQ